MKHTFILFESCGKSPVSRPSETKFSLFFEKPVKKQENHVKAIFILIPLPAEKLKSCMK